MYGVVHVKFNQLVYENVDTITGLPIERRPIYVTGIFRSFTYKIAAKTGWHRHGTKLYVTVALCIHLALPVHSYSPSPEIAITDIWPRT